MLLASKRGIRWRLAAEHVCITVAGITWLLLPRSNLPLTRWHCRILRVDTARERLAIYNRHQRQKN